MHWIFAMNKRNIPVPAVAVWSCLSAALGLPGCHHADSPFFDPLADDPPVATASSDAAAAIEPKGEIRQRDFAEDVRVLTESDVTHLPLYWEDPFEDLTSECPDCAGRFAWGLEDFAAWFYSPTRFLVNGLLAPVSMVVNPPWETMESDGVPGLRFLGEQHDARRVH